MGNPTLPDDVFSGIFPVLRGIGALSLIFSLIGIVFVILVLIWLHNISLNTYRTYKDIEEIKEIFAASKTEKPQ